jgi:hypothetical protein
MCLNFPFTWSYVYLYVISCYLVRFLIVFLLPIHNLVLYRLIIGDGSDEFPFILSMSSKALLSVISSASSSLLPCVFHMDSTFKCNENKFPVTLLGISDVQRQFHLLSISVVSHCTQLVYHHLISSLQELVQRVLPGHPFLFSYCMTDCEAAER